MGGEAATVRFLGAKGAGWIALCLPALCCAQTGTCDAATELRPGSVSSAAQDSTQRVEYVFEAAANQTYLIELDQHGLDFVLSIADPRGDTREYGSPLLRDEREIALLENTLPGTYRVCVFTDEFSGAEGRHAIRLSALPPGDDARVWAALRDGAVAYRRGGEQGWADAIAAYETAAELARESGRQRDLAQALFGIAAIEYWYRYAWTRSAELATAAAQLYADLAEPVLEASALHLYAAALIEEATTVPRTSSAGLAPRARALFDEALGLFHRVRRTYERHGRPYEAGLAINNVGLTHYYMGEYAAARASWDEAALLFRQLREWTGELTALGNQAVIAAEQGRLADATAAFERSLEILSANHPDRALTLDNLAATHYARGDFDDALGIFSEAFEVHAQEDAFYIAEGRRIELPASQRSSAVRIVAGRLEEFQAAVAKEPSVTLVPLPLLQQRHGVAFLAAAENVEDDVFQRAAASLESHPAVESRVPVYRVGEVDVVLVNEFIVRFQPDVPLETGRQRLERLGAEVLEINERRSCSLSPSRARSRKPRCAVSTSSPPIRA